MSAGAQAESTAPPPPPVPTGTRAPVRWQLWFWPCLCAVLVADQLSKRWLFQQPIHLPYGTRNPGPISGFPEWLERSYNTGVAWGALRDWPGVVTALTVVLVPVLTAVWWRHFRTAGGVENLAFGAILGGALGNGLDRFRAYFGGLQGVRDFIMVDLHPLGIGYVWPTFNIADAGISVGFVLLATVALAKPKTAPGDQHAQVVV
jgi:signal peptidase II